MKIRMLFMALIMVLPVLAYTQLNVKGRVKGATENKVGQKIDEGVDKGLDKSFEKVGNAFKKKDKKKGPSNKEKEENPESNNGENTPVKGASNQVPSGSSTPQNLKAYNNFDFVAGENIIFEDNFENDMDGEFAAHWELLQGQATVNTKEGNKFLIQTEGNFAIVKPSMKTTSYLTDPFTVEFDYLCTPDISDYGINLFFSDNENENSYFIHASLTGEVNTGYFVRDFKAENPLGENFTNGWHHVSMAYKNSQMKIYIDQNRVLVVPDCQFTPISVAFGGVAPVIFDNVKIAQGGGMNMLDKLLTDGKFITHGITFDVNKSTLKPESMGVLNEIAKFLKSHPEVKVEIGGHTDSDGGDALNQKLSEQRAEAVKKQLAKMGIEEGRMTTKGYGASKPLAPNTTPENKANNRRVEFIKK